MYGKIFDQIYDGTLAEDWRALITFQQFIVLCDADGNVDMTPQSITRRTGIPIEHIKAGIEILEKSDKYSRTPDEEGRRIELIDDHRPWGWHIVNHEKYKKLQDSDTVRAQTRERVKKHREKKKRNVTDGNGEKRHTDTDINTDTNTLNPSTSKNSFSTEDRGLAIYIHSKIKELNPKAKDPSIDKWANEIRLMRERDKRSHEEIIDIFTWANNDPFWRTNILSPSKLRKQFDQLTIKSGGANDGAKRQGQNNGLDNRSRSQKVSDKLREIGQRDIDQNGFTASLGDSDPK